MNYKTGPMGSCLDIYNYMSGWGLYDGERHVADVALAWNMVSWYVLKVYDGPIPEECAGPYANLRSLEECLRTGLERRASTET